MQHFWEIMCRTIKNRMLNLYLIWLNTSPTIYYNFHNNNDDAKMNLIMIYLCASFAEETWKGDRWKATLLSQARSTHCSKIKFNNNNNDKSFQSVSIRRVHKKRFTSLPFCPWTEGPVFNLNNAGNVQGAIMIQNQIKIDSIILRRCHLLNYTIYASSFYIISLFAPRSNNNFSKKKELNPFHPFTV